MPKLEPIELEFTFDKKINQEAKVLHDNLRGVGEQSKKSADDLKRAIEAQRKVIGDVEKDIASLEKQIKKTAPGRIQAELIQETQAAKKALTEEKAILNELDAEFKKTSAATQTLFSQKRKLTEQLVFMEMAGKRGTAEYDAMARKLAELTDRMGDAATQARILAHDNAGLQGVISGMSGLTGAMSVGAGAVGLFGGENEKLMKIQTRVQSLMAITMGLQQVANVLNKDSAFMISTVGRVKQLWAKSIELVNTRLKINIGLTKALMVTGIGILIAGVTALVMLYNRWRKSQEDNLAIQKEINAANSEAGKEAGKARIEMELTMSRIRSFNGTKEQEKKVVEELNNKYGEAFGQYKTLAEWYDVLKQKSGDYVQSMFLQAKVQGAINKAIELDTKAIETAQKSLDEFKETGDGMVRQSGGSSMYGGTYLAFDKAKAEQQRQQRKDAAIKAINEERDTILEEAIKLQDDLDNLKNKSGLFQGGGNKSEQSKKEYDAEKELQKQLLAIRRQTAQLLFDQQEDSLQKRLDQVDREHSAELDKISEFQHEIINRYNEANKEKAGFKPLSTEDGKIKAGVAAIDPELAKQFEEEIAQLTQAYESRKTLIRKEAATEAGKIMKDVADSYLSEQERELRAVREKYAAMRQELIRYQGVLTEAQSQTLQAAQERDEQAINDDWFLKTSDAFVTLFGDINRMGTKALEQALFTAREIVNRYQNQLSASDLESYLNAIRRAEQELRQRNPFKALYQSLKEYQKATNELEKEEALRAAFESGNESLEVIKENLDKVTASLKEIGLLGEEDIKTINEITGIVDGATTLAAGLMTGDVASIVTGSVDIVTNAITLFDTKHKRIQKDIEKYKKQLAELSREYRQLERAASDALGTDVFSAQVDQVTNLEKQIQKNRDLMAAEQSKRKKKRDDNLIEGYKDEMLQLQNQIEDVYQNIFEGIVQTNAKGLADDLASKLVEAFKSGEDAAKSFEEVSSQVLQNAVKNALKLQLLEQPIQQALKGLKDKMGREVDGVFQYDGLTEQEAEDFKAEIAAIGQVYANALKDLGHVFDDVSSPDSSLTGSIKGVTEETASALGGQITAIRIGQADMQELIREQLLHTAEIAANTRYNKHLEEIRDILKNNSGDTLRSKGL